MQWAGRIMDPYRIAGNAILNESQPHFKTISAMAWHKDVKWDGESCPTPHPHNQQPCQACVRYPVARIKGADGHQPETWRFLLSFPISPSFPCVENQISTSDLFIFLTAPGISLSYKQVPPPLLQAFFSHAEMVSIPLNQVFSFPPHNSFKPQGAAISALRYLLNQLKLEGDISSLIVKFKSLPPLVPCN